MFLWKTGGANHVGNLCSAPIIADTRTDEVLFQSSYYYIGHFARFVRPGARRILCSTTREDLEATAFVNPDGTVCVVVLNRTEQAHAFALETLARQALATAPRDRSPPLYSTNKGLQCAQPSTPVRTGLKTAFD